MGQTSSSQEGFISIFSIGKKVLQLLIATHDLRRRRLLLATNPQRESHTGSSHSNQYPPLGRRGAIWVIIFCFIRDTRLLCCLDHRSQKHPVWSDAFVITGRGCACVTYDASENDLTRISVESPTEHSGQSIRPVPGKL